MGHSHRQWGQRNASVVVEAWLFGSYAIGTERPDSDVDICLRLAPNSLGNYFASGDEWQRELAVLLRRSVNLEAVLPDSDAEREVMATGILLFARARHFKPWTNRLSFRFGAGSPPSPWGQQLRA